jgi:hypothetical protein
MTSLDPGADRADGATIGTAVLPADRRRLLAAAVAFVVLFGFLARAATFKAPLLDHHAWRQADTASIARNFARERFNLLYPQVDQRGASAVGYVETGLELFAFVVAAVSKLAGFHTETGRLLGAGLFVVSAILAHGFLRRRYGDIVALAGLFAYAFAFPLMMFVDRAFMNEPLLICLSFVCLRATQAYLAGGGRSTLAVVCVASALVGMIKLPYLIVLAPIAGLFAERDGIGLLRRPALYLVVVVALAAAGPWYWHAHLLAAGTGISFGMTDKLYETSTVFSPAFVVQLGRRFFKDIFGVSLLFFLVGAVAVVRRRRLCETFGLAGFVVYLVAVAKGNFHHDYYQLPVMVIAPALVGLGLADAIGWLAARLRQPPLVVGTVLCAALVLSTFVRSTSFHSWYEWDPDVLQACGQSRTFLKPGDLLLFVEDNNPKVMFCMDRKGWLLTAAESDDARLEATWRQGATVAVVPGGRTAGPAGTWVTAHGAPIFANPAMTVYRLRPNAAGR